MVLPVLPGAALEGRLDDIRCLPVPCAHLVRMRPVALREPLRRTHLLTLTSTDLCGGIERVHCVRKVRSQLRLQTGLDVSEVFPVGQLGDRQDAEVLGVRERPHAAVASVAVNDSRESRPRHELYQLSEQGLAGVHGCASAWRLSEIPLKVVSGSSRQRAFSRKNILNQKLMLMS